VFNKQTKYIRFLGFKCVCVDLKQSILSLFLQLNE
jgi:hypothetical protein